MHIVPAVLESDFKNLQKRLRFIAKAKKDFDLSINMIQIDLCDGKFVENKTWLPDPVLRSEEKEYLRNFQKRNRVDFEIHLMCKDQKKYFREAIDMGASSVVVHVEKYFTEYLSTEKFPRELLSIMSTSHDYQMSIVFCIQSEMIIENEAAFLDFLLFIFKFREIVFFETGVMWSFNLQLMGIAQIGAQGQKFDSRVLSLISLINAVDFKFVDTNEKRKGNINIQIDGAMNEETVKAVKKLGVKKVIVGSYLIKSDSKDLNEEEFKCRFEEISK